MLIQFRNFVILTVRIKFNDVETTRDEDNEVPNNVEDDEEDEVDNAEEELDAYEALDLVLTSLCSDFTFCWMFFSVISSMAASLFFPLFKFINHAPLFLG
jgi:hypothetical protein